MNISYRIWIPSKQKYIRFYEINCEQYRCILKSMENTAEFDYHINQLLVKNIVDKTIDLEDMTVIDKFVIILQLKIHSCSDKLKLVYRCENCESDTKVSVDLNEIIETLAPKIDKNFEQTFFHNNMKIICDVPNISLKEYDDYNITDTNKLIEYYLYSYIREIHIDSNIISLNKMSLSDKILICEKLPFKIMMTIKNDFIEKVHDIFQSLIVIDKKCETFHCEKELKMNFDIRQMTDIIKILFRDDIPMNVLARYSNISHTCHFDIRMYESICPAELNELSNIVSESNKSSSESGPNNNDSQSFFEKYGSPSKHLVESPSEFL